VRVTTKDIQELYEDQEWNEKTLVNGLREHVDRLHHVMKLVWTIDPWSILDVGCNRGLFGQMVQWSHQRAKRIVGVDVSRLNCAHVVLHADYAEAHFLNASEPFELQERFDLVLCMELLEHVPTPETVVQNVQRHLKPKGLAIFSCPLEEGPVDGEFHVRHVSMEDLVGLVEGQKMDIRDKHFLRSHFCEKPKWQGWNYVIASKGVV
jgi:2-polyprenyl-3-methyl-5-hydroxy-6-metoxy-1,4-benzoquinol methylase